MSPPDRPATGRPDDGPPDTGRPDAGRPDAGRPDTGPPAPEPPDGTSDAPEATVPTVLPLGSSAVLVAVGGAAGALARYELELLFPAGTGSFPWATAVVNVSGALVLGFVLTVATGRWARRWWAVGGRPLLATGFIGAYTTWSTSMVETVQLARHHAPATAVASLAATLVLGLAAAALGVGAGARVAGVGRAGSPTAPAGGRS